MSEQRHADELAWEQSVNARYIRQARADAADSGRGLETVAAPSSTGWTGSGPKKPIPRGRTTPLCGRVALAADDEDLGRSFYVGGEGGRFTRLDDGAIVVSWAAPAAQLFYVGREARTAGPEGVDPRGVAARRTFKAQDQHLLDFDDEYESGADPEIAFPLRAGLHIPKPPGVPADGPAQPSAPTLERPVRSARGRSADRHRAPGTTTEPPADRLAGAVPGTAAASPAQRTAGGATTGRDTARATRPEEQPVPTSGSGRGPRPLGREPPQPSGSDTVRPRAERLLRDALDAPKTGELAPVLATLQPEQYRLVTWPSGENLAVQGHPGTGKTIIAAHRAGFLVLPKDADDQGPRLHKVALVGPSDRWKAHIQPTVTRLVDEGVDVLSLEELVRGWADLPRALHPTSEQELHSRWAIGRIVDRAASTQSSRLRDYKPAARVRELVNSLVHDTAVHRRLTRPEGADLRAWLRAAGDYEQARRDTSYLLFLAAAGLVAGRAGRHSGYQHIVVDEAQDIRPVEWWMLAKMFRAGTKERWSLFGDMNQRRSDFTWKSWASLADLLQLSAEDADQLPEPENLRNGYRSTRQILSYAGALLPRGERANHAFRNGPEPSVRQAGPKQVVSVAAEAAERLTIRHHQGSVAVISYRQEIADEIERSLTKRQWRRDSEGDRSLRRDHRGCRLSVLRPVEARGLEFDAVVVVEPADFRPNMGRHGELYTSLTRANQEFVIVHSKAMPKPISGRGNRVRG